MPAICARFAITNILYVHVCKYVMANKFFVHMYVCVYMQDHGMKLYAYFKNVYNSNVLHKDVLL